jgi:hypothetical protein
MDVLARSLRRGRRRRDLNAVRSQLAQTTIPMPGRFDWDLEKYEGLLAEPYRARARATGLRCLLCERLEPFLVVAFIASITASTLADQSQVSTASMWVMNAIVAIAATLVVLNHQAMNTMARSCLTAVTRGLGRNLDDSVELPSR